MGRGYPRGVVKKHALIVAAALAGAWGCSDGAPVSDDPLVARGRMVYVSACIACHNTDPTRAGSVAPALAGASEELLEWKVLRGEYPPGYQAKQVSGVMPRFTNLKDDIGALAAYLGTVPPEPAS